MHAPSVTYFGFCKKGLRFPRPEEVVPLQIVSLSLNLQLGLFWSTQVTNGSWPDVQVFLQFHFKSAVSVKRQALTPLDHSGGHLPAWQSKASLWRCLQLVRDLQPAGVPTQLRPLPLCRDRCRGSSRFGPSAPTGRGCSPQHCPGRAMRWMEPPSPAPGCGGSILGASPGAEQQRAALARGMCSLVAQRVNITAQFHHRLSPDGVILLGMGETGASRQAPAARLCHHAASLPCT